MRTMSMRRRAQVLVAMTTMVTVGAATTAGALADPIPDPGTCYTVTLEDDNHPDPDPSVTVCPFD